MMNDFTVLDLLNLDLKDHNSLNLKCLEGRKGLTRIITDSEINRPGLTLSGFFEEFAYHRIQLFGKGEVAYLKMLEETKKMEKPCMIIFVGRVIYVVIHVKLVS